MAPYTLLYGHQPRGPLHILRESWTGERTLPLDLNKSETEYMQELKSQLELIRSYADNHVEFAQAVYVNEFNKRAKDKSFEIGDKVIVLFPDSTFKLKSQWQTGIVVDLFDEYSYLIEMQDGKTQKNTCKTLATIYSSCEQCYCRK